LAAAFAAFLAGVFATGVSSLTVCFFLLGVALARVGLGVFVMGIPQISLAGHLSTGAGTVA
jgi:hypothetical protein